MRLPAWGRRRAVDRDDVQANVIDGVNHPHAHHLVVRIDDAAAGRRLLRDLESVVDDAMYWRGGKPPLLQNVGLSASGLRALGVDDAVITRFGRAFASGMAARADVLGDRGPSDPSTWVPGFATGDAHVLIWLHADQLARLDAETTRWLDAVAQPGLALVHQLRASLHSHAREQFGYSDGFGQPEIDGVEREPGEEGQLGRLHERPLAAGEFLFGYADSFGVVGSPAKVDFAQNGTILVWRQLHQDVAAFRLAVERAATAVGIGPDEMAAKLVGRWRDGSPLVLSPDPPRAGAVTDRIALDDFRYADDPAGIRCPIGAHIRRANPRDSLSNVTMATRHRIIRRGMPYGPPLSAGAADDGLDRGLLFACFNASPERQFEFIQQQWCNDGTQVRRDDERDPLVGAPGGTGQFLVQGHPPRVVTGLTTFVTTRAGEYFLVPGQRGLHRLASG